MVLRIAEQVEKTEIKAGLGGGYMEGGAHTE